MLRCSFVRRKIEVNVLSVCLLDSLDVYVTQLIKARHDALYLNVTRLTTAIHATLRQRETDPLARHARRVCRSVA